MKKPSKVAALRQMREAQVEQPRAGTFAYHRAEAKKHFSAMKTSALALAEELRIIRDEKLYLAEHHTFEGFCEAEFGIGRSQAYRLIDGAKIAISLSPRGDIAPTTEKQLRPLKALPEEQRQDAWDEAVDRSGGEAPTHRTVQAVVRDMRDEPVDDSEPEVDPIAEWERTQKELEAAQELTAKLQSDDVGKELAAMHQQVRHLSARIEQLSTTASEAQKQATYQGKLLRKIREALGVESNKEILQALAK